MSSFGTGTGTGSGPGIGPGSAVIPPIEIGSFVAPQPDRSEFIGSASGVFFVHTVFRAFADTAPPSPDGTAVTAPSEPSFATAAAAAGPSSSGAAEVVADPGSAHTFLVASENTQDDALRNKDKDKEDSDQLQTVATPSSGRGYHVAVPGLGRAPDLHVANRLVMLYFQNWHPMFPFLHGPSFFGQVAQFYDEPPQPGQPGFDQHGEICRAIIFQCVLNMTASSSVSGDVTPLPPECRIESTLALTHLLGIVCSANTALTLQALLAMELYLIGRASLRAASTVHGALTRMLYHLGLHRCPYRFLQLPKEVCNLRKRIFWSAYVLDRYLSQSLGHPASISDGDLDTCIPGMKELHQPVRPRTQPQEGSGGVVRQEEQRTQIPKTPSVGHQRGNASISNVHGSMDATSPARERRENVPSPAYHHRTKPDEAGEYVLAYLATYSRLLGKILKLFHVSISARDISWDKVLSLTSQIQAWWNSLPSALQDDSNRDNHSSQYAPLFLVLYNSLVLFVNRPFLSLPTHRTDFLSSLQAALTASRTIIARLRHVREGAALVWLGTLSALWMSGLVISFASLLGHYPFEKAEVELQDCLRLFSVLGGDDPSAKRCRTALNTLLTKLKQRSENPSPPQPYPDPKTTYHDREVDDERGSRTPHPGSRHSGSSSKRRRFNSEGFPPDAPPVPQPVPYDPFPNPAVMPGSGNFWQPVLEYTGPDFGFDSSIMDGYRMEQQNQQQGQVGGGALLPTLDIGAGGLYSDEMWEAYLQGVGDNLNF